MLASRASHNLPSRLTTAVQGTHLWYVNCIRGYKHEISSYSWPNAFTLTHDLVGSEGYHSRAVDWDMPTLVVAFADGITNNQWRCRKDLL